MYIYVCVCPLYMVSLPATPPHLEEQRTGIRGSPLCFPLNRVRVRNKVLGLELDVFTSIEVYIRVGLMTLGFWLDLRDSQRPHTPP